MERRGRGRFVSSAGYFPGSSLTEKISPASNLPNQKENGLAELHGEMMASLRALKKDLEHEHTLLVKATEAYTAKLKKQVKQEIHEASEISKAIDADWKNFLADLDEDTRENQGIRPAKTRRVSALEKGKIIID
ncbi:hypothetical protein R1flu_019139 [Riccia fluitans]|uniref:Uncharacterized protein n=1 Tax=Riccia fluitans TaxID=41844 RepID=A0ABD1ZJD0_9MARC